jgi:ribosomal protein L17
MAGGAAKYRHLSRSSSHRQALLRNLVTSLFKHESITTTWAKAKEAQRLAEKLITLGKKNTEASRKRALSTFYVCPTCPKKGQCRLELEMGLNRFGSDRDQDHFGLNPSKSRIANHELNEQQTPHEILPKLFGPLRERYAERPGGYTRVLRVEPKKDDQAASAILELVDGPKDMRFALTARTVARRREQGLETLNDMTLTNVKKVTQFRKDGVEALEREISKLKIVKEKEGKKVGVKEKAEKEAEE